MKKGCWANLFYYRITVALAYPGKICVSYNFAGTIATAQDRPTTARWESARGGWRMPPHLLALVVVLGLILGDAAGSLTNGAQAHIQFR